MRAISRALLLLLTPLAAAVPARAQDVGREAAERLEFAPVRFEAPRARIHEVEGVRVLHLEDPTLPLVNVFARFSGGFSNFSREHYAAATALPGLIRSGGTLTLPADSVDELSEFYALSMAFGSGGETSFSSLNVLVEYLDVGVSLWADMLRNPRFDPRHVEVWRGQELEAVLRRKDDPGRLAFSEFNRLMFGDHPIGWEMDAADLEPEDLSETHLRWLHARIFCPENLVLGVTGDVSWDEVRPLLQRVLEGWPRCPEPIPESPDPEMRREPGVFLIPRDLDQATVVMAHPGGIRQADDRDFYASRIGNSILGASGFGSRLMDRVRTEKGYAYSASSLWTAPSGYEGIVGALTRTKSESTIAAVQLILSTIDEMTREAPSREEVSAAVEEIVNGFVFNFEAPSQVVSRQMFYAAEGLPEDWLERYLDGIQDVRSADVLRVFRRHVDPDRMTILILGDPARFDLPPETLGPVRILDVDGVTRPAGTAPVGSVSERPRGGPRSPR